MGNKLWKRLQGKAMENSSCGNLWAEPENNFTLQESLTAPAENLHGLHEAAAAVQAQAAAEAAAAAAAAGVDQAEQQGQPVYRDPRVSLSPSESRLTSKSSTVPLY